MIYYNNSLFVWFLGFFITIVFPVRISAQPTEGLLTPKTETAEGFVDGIEFAESSLSARGWAASNDNSKINRIIIQKDSFIIFSGEIKSEIRPDVVKARGRADWLNSGWCIQTK